MGTFNAWQIVVIVTVFTAYLLHYPCKVHLYVVMQEFRTYIDPHNEAKAQKYTGIMLMLGYVSYAAGKILLALIPIQRLKSPLVLILITIVFAPLFTFLFAILDISDYTLRVAVSFTLWTSIRFVIAAAWMGLVQIVPNWVPPSHHARVMAVLNLSWLFGDAIARSILGWTYHFFDEDWRSVFYVSAAMTTIAILPTILLVRDTPMERGLPPISDNEDNVYFKEEQRRFEEQQHTSYSADANINNLRNTVHAFSISDSSTREDLDSTLSKKHQHPTLGTCDLLKPLLKEPLFYAVLILNFLYLFIRELYNMFFIAWLEDTIDINKGIASTISAVVPLVGSISVIVAGVWLDEVKQKHWRLSIIPIFAVVTIGCLACFTWLDPSDLSLEWIISLTILFGLSLYGPYSLMAGVLSVDIGGQTSAGMVSAFVSAAGFSSGVVGSFISAFHSYNTIWFFTTCAAVCILIVGIVLFFYNRTLYHRKLTKTEEKTPLMV